MEAKADQPTTVDEYIARYPDDVQQILSKIRAVIREAAPQAEERIAYGMPGYYQKGPLIYFAAHTRHIGIYPLPEGLEAFKEELAGYKGSKGSVHFPLDKPMPYDLIGKMARLRVAENLAKKSKAK